MSTLAGAFATLAAKRGQVVETEKSHIIAIESSEVMEVNGKQCLVVALPIESIGQAKTANSKYSATHPDVAKRGQLKPESERGIGFMWPSVPFEINGVRFSMKPGWTSIK